MREIACLFLSHFPIILSLSLSLSLTLSLTHSQLWPFLSLFPLPSHHSLTLSFSLSFFIITIPQHVEHYIPPWSINTYSAHLILVPFLSYLESLQHPKLLSDITWWNMSLTLVFVFFLFYFPSAGMALAKKYDDRLSWTLDKYVSSHFHYLRLSRPFTRSNDDDNYCQIVAVRYKGTYCHHYYDDDNSVMKVISGL